MDKYKKTKWMNSRHWLQALALLSISLAVSSCSVVVSKAGNSLGNTLSSGILSQDDPETVRAGLPAYLLLIDGLLQDKPDDAALLLSASKMYSAYAGSIADNPERQQRLAGRSYVYAMRAVCVKDHLLCENVSKPFEDFAPQVARLSAKDMNLSYALATAWAGLIQANPSDWSRIADLPKVELLLERIIAINPAQDMGMAQAYLGVLNSLRPEALGGNPEKAKRHFELAWKLSEHKNLMSQALYAEYYARLVFDQELHDGLLEAVIAADPKHPGMTLINVLAQERAKRLQESAKDYF